MQISYSAIFSWVCIILAIITASVAFSTSKWWNTEFSTDTQKNKTLSVDSGLFRMCTYSHTNTTACHITNQGYRSKTKKTGLAVAQILASMSVVCGLLSVIICTHAHAKERINHRLHVSALVLVCVSFVSALSTLVIFSPAVLVKNHLACYYGYFVMIVSTFLFGVGVLLMSFV